MNGCRWIWRSAAVLCAVAMAAPAVAQPQAPAPRPAAAVEAQSTVRYQLAVMEGALVAAVQQGARVVSLKWRQLSPDMLFISGTARARGFRLDSYGVFFDVEVPSMRQSVAWTWRQLDRDTGASVALQTFKNHLKTVSDPAARRDLELAIKRLELQVGPPVKIPVDPDVTPGVRTAGDPTVVAMPPTPPRQALAAPGAHLESIPEDPGAAYTTEVQNALFDAMLDYSHALPLGADEWLTVAAHDDADRRLGAADPYETVTFLMRIKGADLQAFRAGRLSRADARLRIEMKEY